LQIELLVINGGVFATLAVGLAIRLRRKPRDFGMVAVYGRLGAALTKRFPDLPLGFTLREGLARARSYTPGIDWVSLEKELGSYEAFRFGGGKVPTGPNDETLKLLRTLGGG
jgi:hypothetical protein